MERDEDGRRAGVPGCRRVLLVEDNADGRALLEDLLTLWGHESECVSDAEPALAILRERLPEAALIDIALPGLDGYALARQVRRLPGGDRVLLVAMTGYGRPEDRDRALAAGFDVHLTKPIEPDELARLLREGRDGAGRA